MISIPTPVLLASLLLIAPTYSAVLNLQFSPAYGTAPDPIYPATSTMSAGTSGVPGLMTTLAGRGYGVDQAGTARWGIVAGGISWLAEAQGWTVRNGFAPDAIGSTISTSTGVEVAASYLSVMLQGLDAGTVLNDVSLTFSDVTYLKPDQAWAGTSMDSFSHAIALTYSKVGTSRQLSVTLPELTQAGTDPLEIRLYGIIGGDEGAFRMLTVNGQVSGPSPIPEPDVRMLVTALVLGATVAFRRRTGSLRRF